MPDHECWTIGKIFVCTWIYECHISDVENMCCLHHIMKPHFITNATLSLSLSHIAITIIHNDSSITIQSTTLHYTILYLSRWADGVSVKKPIAVSANEYVDLLMTWTESQLNDESIFPVKFDSSYPKNFHKI